MKNTLFLLFGLVLTFSLFFAFSNHHVSATQYVSPIADSFLTRQLTDKLVPHTDNFAVHAPVELLTSNAALSPDTAYIAIDWDTGRVILSHDASQRRSIASLTKLMSAIVALDLASPTEEVTISQKAAAEVPTKIGVVPGEKMSIDELLHAMLMTSANDAAQAVADGINEKYHSPIFVWAMNKKAKMLGLINTHFANPEGFDNQDNYSTPEDLAILSHYALTYYPEIAQIVSQDFLHVPANNTHKQFDLYNWNGLLDVYPNISGVKIGNTDYAKFTDIVVSERSGHKVLVVLLGADGVLQRDLGSAGLLDDAFAKVYNLSPIAVTPQMLEAKYSTWKYWN